MNINPAAELLGHSIGNWKVVEKIDISNSSGGNFSFGYIVKNNTGEKAFLKALDYSTASMIPGMQAENLNKMTNAYLFERNLLEQCGRKGLRNVVRMIDHGEYRHLQSWPYAVNYLVMEKADCSARDMLTLNASLDTLWALNSLHGIAVGIKNLHEIDVAHQDVKPSNVLFFKDEKTSKIGDVGRASTLSIESQHDKFSTAGDPAYSPFEQLYGVKFDNWRKRRYSCDAFMFGNLIMCYFNGVSITVSTLRNMDDKFLPRNWGDEYVDVLPYIEASFFQVIDSFIPMNDISLRESLMTMIIELCHPDPNIRGDKKERGIQKFSLQRYISHLDRLYKKYMYKVMKG